MPLIQVNPEGDLALGVGRLVLVDGLAFIRQKLAARYRFFLAEWFLDRRMGVPYYRDVLVHNPDLAVVRSVFKRVALQCPGVLSLTRFDIQFDRVARQASFNFEAICDGGHIIVAPTDRDFILRV